METPEIKAGLCFNREQGGLAQYFDEIVNFPSITFIVHKYNYTDNGQMWGECTPYFDYVEPIGT